MSGSGCWLRPVTHCLYRRCCCCCLRWLTEVAKCHHTSWQCHFLIRFSCLVFDSILCGVKVRALFDLLLSLKKLGVHFSRKVQRKESDFQLRAMKLLERVNSRNRHLLIHNICTSMNWDHLLSRKEARSPLARKISSSQLLKNSSRSLAST